jgi:aspartate/methionine/tyrosine aminotransferase
MALSMQGVRAVPLPCDAASGFLPDPDRLAAAIAAHRPRALVLVSPNNPTGAVASPELIRRVFETCQAAGVWLVLDETYRDFLAPGSGAPHDLFRDPAWREGLVHLYSFSKAYCVPGHRLGAVAAGPRFLRELAKVLDTLQICPPRAAQLAMAWAVPALREWRAGNRAIMVERAEAFRAGVGRLPGWRLDSLGSFFAYLRLPEGAPDAPAVAEMLAAERGLLTLPGPFFGPGQGGTCASPSPMPGSTPSPSCPAGMQEALA